MHCWSMESGDTRLCTFYRTSRSPPYVDRMVCVRHGVAFRSVQNLSAFGVGVSGSLWTPQRSKSAPMKVLNLINDGTGSCTRFWFFCASIVDWYQFFLFSSPPLPIPPPPPPTPTPPERLRLVAEGNHANAPPAGSIIVGIAQKSRCAFSTDVQHRSPIEPFYGSSRRILSGSVDMVWLSTRVGCRHGALHRACAGEMASAGDGADVERALVDYIGEHKPVVHMGDKGGGVNAPRTG